MEEDKTANGVSAEGDEAPAGEPSHGKAPAKESPPDTTAWEEKAKGLPARPGVYLFKDRDGKVIYVGKAKSLRARVRSYTREAGDGRYNVVFLRNKTRDLDYIVTDTEKEALILENNLIKKYWPRYNVKLRDDKTYFHVRLTTSEKYPRLVLTRRPKKGGKDMLFGPFSSSGAVKETIRTLQEIFPLRRCKERFRTRSRACLNNQIGKCLGPCAELVPKDEYDRVVSQVIKFMKGKRPELIEDLRRQMKEASEAEEYERAAGLRDRIGAIEKTLEQQKVDSTMPVDRDVIGFYREGDRVVVHRLGYRGGVLLVSEPHSFARVTQSDEEVLSSFMAQVYPERDDPPEEVLVPFMPEQADMLADSLSEMRGKKCALRVPERGEWRKLVLMAGKNAEETLRRESDKSDDRERAISEVKRKLRLAKEPRWIECVDISILQGEAPVGSVVKFIDGDPDKSGYRRYRIKTVDGTNDYDMMREVLSRRFGRALKEGEDLPDLLVVDGGKGQLNVARAVKDDLGLEGVELAGLAKDREKGEALSDEIKRTGERVFVPGAKDPVFLKPGTAGLFLMQRVRDEAHRFAIEYHKKLRGKKLTRSVLEDVPGIGPKKSRALIKRFGSIKAVRDASPEELADVPGISEKDAENIASLLKHS